MLTAAAPSVSAQLGSLLERFTFSDRITPFPLAVSEELLARLLAGEDAARLAVQTRLFGSFAGQAQTLKLTDGIRARRSMAA
ncbi:hypothetical protein [Novosphingobium sp. PASSN1]|uniref:hypothetical protein n=1 Tax=Novosphingobium sp. PASSN1 TaxID=2015561 RepID=UPI0025E37D27|nr:hypothetical protein [Novosphingobium sp. PASSN1]